MKRWVRWLVVWLTGMAMTGCVSQPTILVKQPFHEVVSKDDSVVVYAFDNYTETPEAGRRAANLAAGVLSASGYRVKNRASRKVSPPGKRLAAASKEGAVYLLEGGVNEWRYKTGIDGEPAVSVTLRLRDTRRGRVVWSGVASAEDWGNASVGTTAQKLFTALFSR